MTKQPDTAATRRTWSFPGMPLGVTQVIHDLCDALDAARAKYDEIGDEVREMDVQIWIGKYRDEQARAEAAEADNAILAALRVIADQRAEAAEARIAKALVGGDLSVEALRALTGGTP